ncbi:uncharacterized protein LOC133532591 [Cydia pomonella]|uniref:uncharacterized protein LOC133532591 n=1 Tax=Cydia pomonella TaxID=82600 RepID=UPI002ADE2BE4|nr:uncharacterized protein LOC133532591 [Cydia pomonella]XP_061727321.1 uncharacterized protein LOC133532591 [Cydia pomonella]
MNPFGPPVSFPATVNNVYSNNSPDHLTSKIQDEWQVVYSWPPYPNPAPEPRRITLGQPTILQSALFKCRCNQQVVETYPITVKEDEKTEVKACEIVTTEESVPAALDRTTCGCQPTPFYEKIVVLAMPTNENLIFMYQRHKNVQYTPECPNTCLLLAREVPSNLNIENVAKGMDIAKRKGGYTFEVKQE